MVKPEEGSESQIKDMDTKEEHNFDVSLST